TECRTLGSSHSVSNGPDLQQPKEQCTAPHSQRGPWGP
ncbi:uncharacterized, partial [Tachysurus ichikawai]